MNRLLAAVFVLLSAFAGVAQAQSLSASPSSLYASQSVTATWSGITSPSSTDWIGVYAVSAADNAPVVWQYTNGNTSGSAPQVIPNTTVPGSYELRLFSNNGYTKLATSNGVTIDPPPPANLSASPASLYASQSVTGTWSSILSPTSTDWFGLYAVGAADNAPVIWQHTNGSASGNAPLVIPNTTAPGSYELRLFSNNGYIKLATSNGVTVQPPPAANLSASPASLYASQTVTGTWASILSPTTIDWFGLYAVGAADSAPVVWQYTNGSASGNGPLVIPNTTAAGSYELRLFSNNGYIKIGTSNGVTVQPPPAAALSVAPGSASPGGSVTATWSSILAPTSTDWIGLYIPGAADGALISWRFTTGVAAGNVPFSIPANLAPGSYELRLFANNGYTRLATSGVLSVGVMKLSFIHPDHLNTPRQVYDDQQQLRWKWDQAEPFGVTTPDENPGSLGAFELPLRFPGQYADKETNLSYNLSRDYEANVGRYIQSDPFGILGGLGTYTYARGSALQFVDMTGELEPITTCLIASAAFYGVMSGASKVQKFIYNGQLTSQASQTAAVANKVCQEQKTQSACNLVKDSDIDLLRGSAATAGAASSLPGALGGGAAPGGNVDIRRTVDILRSK